MVVWGLKRDGLFGGYVKVSIVVLVVLGGCLGLGIRGNGE